MAKKGKKHTPTLEHMPLLHPHAAGIAVGAEAHWGCVPAARAAQAGQHLSALTCAVPRLADWFTPGRRPTVVLAATGVYGMPRLHLLEAGGFAVARVHARHVTHVPGRPHTARFDGRGPQKVPRYGVVAPSCRPPAAICQRRRLLRQRDHLRPMTGKHLQPLHQALAQMQLHLHHVRRDGTGVTGLRRRRAIIAGARAPRTVAP
jgi:transposase